MGSIGLAGPISAVWEHPYEHVTLTVLPRPESIEQVKGSVNGNVIFVSTSSQHWAFPNVATKPALLPPTFQQGKFTN